MNFLKGLAISLLALILLFSLSIFGDMLMLRQTLLNPEFVTSQVNRLDISLLAEELLTEQVPIEEELVVEVINNTVSDLEPWVKEQANTFIYSGYDYLMGRSQNLRLSISLEPVKDSLKDNLKEKLLQSLPPELTEATPGLIELFIDEAYQEIAKDIPETYSFDKTSWSAEVQLILEQARRAISYSDIVYIASIGLVLLSILGILLMSRPLRGAIRRVGIVLFIYGALQYVGIFIITGLVETQMMQAGLPVALQTWLPQLLNDLFAPLEVFSICAGSTGIMLIIAGAIPWGRRQDLGTGRPSTCPKCGSQYAPAQQYCGACGQKLQQYSCSRCKAIIDPACRFCTNCGARMH